MDSTGNEADTGIRTAVSGDVNQGLVSSGTSNSTSTASGTMQPSILPSTSVGNGQNWNDSNVMWQNQQGWGPMQWSAGGNQLPVRGTVPYPMQNMMQYPMQMQYPIQMQYPMQSPMPNPMQYSGIPPPWMSQQNQQPWWGWRTPPTPSPSSSSSPPSCGTG